MFLAPTPGEREETTRVFGQLTARRDELKTDKHKPERSEERKIYDPHLWGFKSKGSLPLNVIQRTSMLKIQQKTR